MRLPMLPLIIFILVNLLVDWYIYRAIIQRTKSRLGGRAYLCLTAVMTVLIIVAALLPRRSGSQSVLLADMWLIYAYLSVYIPKYIFLMVDCIAKIPRLWKHRRVKFLSRIGVVLALIVFIGMWWGALVNRYSLEVKDVDVELADLPDVFDGYKIVQFSDFHVGTYGADTAFVANVVDEINRLDPDLIVFTGDIVNREASELRPFVSPLSRLRAHDGVMAILGNHDYGDYKDWVTAEDKKDDRRQMVSHFGTMGWRLLLNETVMIHRGNDSIAIIGVENIGDPPFKVYGDLKKAYETTSDKTVKILLSHTPAHWVGDIKNKPDNNIALTLSGHTHAMQIELFGVSPAALRYPTWGGLYSDSLGRYLYVNIGLGTVGMPMRVGAPPELTLITLNKQN